MTVSSAGNLKATDQRGNLSVVPSTSRVRMSVSLIVAPSMRKSSVSRSRSISWTIFMASSIVAASLHSGLTLRPFSRRKASISCCVAKLLPSM